MKGGMYHGLPVGYPGTVGGTWVHSGENTKYSIRRLNTATKYTKYVAELRFFLYIDVLRIFLSFTPPDYGISVYTPYSIESINYIKRS